MPCSELDGTSSDMTAQRAYLRPTGAIGVDSSVRRRLNLPPIAASRTEPTGSIGQAALQG